MGKSKRSKALDIPRAVKDKVHDRDGYCCIICGRAGAANAHYIARSRSGLGVEQNVVTLCPICHERSDHGKSEVRAEYKGYIREYLISKYEDWDESKLVYNKWED